MSTPQVVPWRAGRRSGESPSFASGQLVEFDSLSIPVAEVVLLADISEFQPDLSDAVYLQNFSPAIIFRAMYGTTVDKAWYGGGRRTALHAAGAKFVGIYQYIVAGEDPVAQADALCALLGSLQPGEKVIADLEEGSGDQQARWVAWADRINSQLGNPPWDYSGENFAATHGLQPVDWIAAYQATEPSPAHLLWQFTDSFTIPGIPGTCDCSVFHGTIAQLAAYAYSGQPAPQPTPTPTPTPDPVPVQETNMPGGVIAGPIATYPISFEVGSVKKIVFYAASPANVTVNIAHGGNAAENQAGSLYNAGTLDVHPRAEYVITNQEDVDAIVLTDVSGPVGWHTE